jgi:surfactin synthase thioesterase subunit
MDGPPAAKLSAPVTVVVAADDPSTADSAVRYRDWGFVTGQVDRHELADGGHYFLRTRPAQAAQAVLVRTNCPRPGAAKQALKGH